MLLWCLTERIEERHRVLKKMPSENQTTLLGNMKWFYKICMEKSPYFTDALDCLKN